MTVCIRCRHPDTASRTGPTQATEIHVQPFHLESITAGADCAVLRIGGEVDVYTAPQLRERVIQLLGHGARHIIADLREVEFLDSTGLGAPGRQPQAATRAGRIAQTRDRRRQDPDDLPAHRARPRLRAPLVIPRGDRRRPALASSPGLRRPQHRGMVPRTRTAVNPAACLNIPPHQARPGNCDSRVQNVSLCAAPDDRNHHPRVEQNGGSARSYLGVGGASQQSRYGLLDGRLLCIYTSPSLGRMSASAAGRACGSSLTARCLLVRRAGNSLVV